MSSAARRVIALGNLAGELKASIEEATRAVGLELFLTREPTKAALDLERTLAVAVLVDMATLGAEQFCKRARSTEKLKGVPIIGMSRTPSELGFSRVFAWGADDLVPLGATLPLERRLRALSEAQPNDANAFGQAVVAEGTTQRRALVGRVLVHAGYDVKFAVDRASVELYASQPETRIVVVSATLGDPRKMIEASVKAGGLATFIVTAEARSVARLAASLDGLPRVAVTSTAGSPEDVLFLANEIVFGKGNRPREWRALYGTPVAFRIPGSNVDDYGFTYDVSPGGLYVRSLLPCEGDEVEVDLRPPGRDDRLRLTADVVRRFAFGSGSVASAPPGFGIRLTGPSKAAIKLWKEACEAYVESGRSKPPAAAMDKAPRAQTPVALAVPPSTLTIESVVAPLPNEHTNVADLMSETLGEAAVPDAGARPVTMDPEGGVREERPSEYMIHAPPLDAVEPPGEARETPKSEPPPARSPSRPPLPMPVAPLREEPLREEPLREEDDKTAVYERAPSDPNLMPEARPAAVEKQPAAVAAQAKQATPEVPRVTGEKRRDPPPREPAAKTGTLLMQRPAPLPDPPGRPVGPPPPPARAPASPATTVPHLHEAPRAAGAAAPAVVPAPASKPDAKKPTPPATAAPSRPDAAPDALETPLVSQAAPSEREALGHAKTVAGFTASEPGLGPVPGAGAPSPGATQRFDARGFAVPAPGRRDEPTETEAPAPPRPPREGSESDAWFDQAPKSGGAPYQASERPHQERRSPERARAGMIALGVVALAAAGIGGFAILSRPAPPAPAPAEPVPPRVDSPATAPIATAPSASAAPPETSAAPPATASAASSAASAPEPSELTDAAPAAAASADSSVTAAPDATGDAALPPVPPADFDLERIPADRAALLVRSSAAARVFVHGRDYGETNRYLLTSCGIRFLRIGRGFNDFIEPGRSFVLKCGKLTEVAIEPAP